MTPYPLDLQRFAPHAAEEYDDRWPTNELFAHDPADGRGDLRRQAVLIEVDADPEEAESILNPRTTTLVAAAFLGISVRHYHRLVDAGVLPTFPKGEVDLAVVQVDFLRHAGEACSVENPRTGGRYEYLPRKKVH